MMGGPVSLARRQEPGDNPEDGTVPHREAGSPIAYDGIARGPVVYTAMKSRGIVQKVAWFPIVGRVTRFYQGRVG